MAGLLRDLVSGNNRVPRPPPRIRERTVRLMVESRERVTVRGSIATPVRRAAAIGSPVSLPGNGVGSKGVRSAGAKNCRGCCWGHGSQASIGSAGQFQSNAETKRADKPKTKRITQLSKRARRGRRRTPKCNPLGEHGLPRAHEHFTQMVIKWVSECACALVCECASVCAFKRAWWSATQKLVQA